MYPTLYEAFLDLFGLDLPFLKIVMTFGFFVAMAFLAGNWAMTAELKRKEALGQISPIKKVMPPRNISREYLSNGVIGFIVGFKVVYLAMHFSELSSNPQKFLLSSQGSVLWGVILAAVFMGFVYFSTRGKTFSKEGKEVDFHPYQMMGGLTMIAAAAGFLGAKVFHHLENWSEFIADPIRAFTEPFSGLTFFGGLICGGAAVLWYANKHGVKWHQMLDVGAPAMMLAYGVGRMGCHFSGDGDWGIDNLSAKPDWLSWLPDWAWAYDYPNNVLGIVLEHPVWPTPLYEIFMALGLFVILWVIRKRVKASGVLFSVYMIFSGVERFSIERIRINTKYHIGDFVFTQAELISVIFVLLGIAGIFYFRKQAQKAQAIDKA